MAWSGDRSNETGLKRRSRLHHLVGQVTSFLTRYPQSLEPVPIFFHFFCAVVFLQGMKDRPVSVLASADAGGVVVLSVCGAYRLITIDLRAHRKPAKGKGRASMGGWVSPGKVDSPRQRRSRRSPGQDSAGISGQRDSDGDFDGAGPLLRPLQLTLSADLSLLAALVEVDGYVELIQVTWRQTSVRAKAAQQ